MTKNHSIMIRSSVILSAMIAVACTFPGLGKDQQDTGKGPESIIVKTEKLRCRDPFILYDSNTDLYYLHLNHKGQKLVCWSSKDLKEWKSLGNSFVPGPDFWGKQDFWAPDIYKYKGKYYIFATFSAPDKKRGTSILVSDKPAGPFKPLVNAPATPAGQQCLDGSLFIGGDGVPWLIYCHEWIEVGDGEIWAVRLKEDLKGTTGKPILLFKASEASWTKSIYSKKHDITGIVTDAPCIVRSSSGKLIMTWSSTEKKTGQYAIGIAVSDGKIEGPWKQQKEPLLIGGGHGMLFRNKKGNTILSYHAPNHSPSFLTLKKAEILESTISIEQ